MKDKELVIGYVGQETGLTTIKIPDNEVFSIRLFESESVISGREARRLRRKQQRKTK